MESNGNITYVYSTALYTNVVHLIKEPLILLSQSRTSGGVQYILFMYSIVHVLLYRFIERINEFPKFLTATLYMA